MTDFEHRGLVDDHLVLREQGDGMLHMTGYAIVTDVFYDVGGVFREKITRGAVRDALAVGPDVVLNLNHGRAGTGLPLARTKSATGSPTLQLSLDTKGMRCDAALDPEDEDTKLLARKLRAGLMSEMSFAFMPTVPPDWSYDGSERTVTAMTIDGGDVSVVIAGANPATTASMRAREIRAAAMGHAPARPLVDHTRRAAERLAVMQARGLR